MTRFGAALTGVLTVVALAAPLHRVGAQPPPPPQPVPTPIAPPTPTPIAPPTVPPMPTPAPALQPPLAGPTDAGVPMDAGVATDAGPGTAVQDEIVATMLVWALDLLDWSNAVAIAEHMLRHGVTLPERYKRDVATFLVDRVADTAKTTPEAVSLDLAREVLALTVDRDMPDQARAKLHRAIGLRLMDDAFNFDPSAETALAGGKAALVDAALAALTEALRLDQNVGVKKQIEQLTRDAKKLAEAAGAAATGSQE